MTRKIIICLILAGALPGAAAAVTHVLGAQKKTLSAASDTVEAGYYLATTLAAIDAELAGVNIKSGVNIFGQVGTYYSMPDTGQTLCYDDVSTIACPAKGAASEQDASNNPADAQMSYTDNGDFTITDNRTGLMWKKCSEGQANDAGCTGAAIQYTWASALSQCTGLTTPGGHTDWRLPSIRELSSIINYSVAAPPFINTAIFPATLSDVYWTSTTFVSLYWGFYVTFNNGGSGSSAKSTSYYVRCVRGGP